MEARVQRVRRLANVCFHVIPAILVCPVRPKSGHSANAHGYECTAYGAAENKSLEIKTPHPRRVPRC